MKHAVQSPDSPAARTAASSAVVVQAVNQQRRRPVQVSRLVDAVRAVLVGESIRRADVSLAIVDEPTIHELNRRYLAHDEPTDVISFVLERADGLVDGQIVVSADAAAVAAPRFGWSAADELLLYAIHGALHLAGYDDRDAARKRTMRRREKVYLSQFGLKPSRGAPSAKIRTSKAL